MRSPLTTLLLLGAALGCSPALAKEGRQNQLTITLENVAHPQRKGVSVGTFAVNGKTVPLPDGTQLFVTLRAKGKAHNATCALIRVPVRDNAFKGGKEWSGRIFAPMTYEVQVDLVLEMQPPAVQKWIRREYGYAADHREVLTRQTFERGTLEERNAFTQKNIRDLLEQTEKLEQLRAKAEKCTATPAAKTEDWSKDYSAIRQESRAWRKSFDDYRRRYVVLLEEGYFRTLLDIHATLAFAVRDHDKGQQVQKRVKVLASRIDLVRHKLSDLVPLEHPEDPGKKKEGK